MELTNIYAFYHLGLMVRTLNRLPTDGSGQEVADLLFQIELNLQPLLKANPEIHLPQSTHWLGIVLAEVKDYREQLSGSDDPDALLQWSLGPYLLRLETALNGFEQAFKSESARANVFTVVQKGLYDTFSLILEGEKSFLPQVRNRLPDRAIYDLRQAARCLAFSCPTAVGFHIIRAIESVVLEYYEVVDGNPWPNTLDRNWNQYISKLEAKKYKVPKRITDRLHEIRGDERNPIAHPEYQLEIDEAFAIFNLAQGVIPMMVKDMLKREKTVKGTK